MRKVLLLTIILTLLAATPAMAAITQIGDKEFEVTDYRVTIPAGQSGTVTLGGGKFQPAEAGGSYLAEVRLRANRTLDSNNFVTVTFDNGVTNTHRSEPGTPNIFAIASGLLNNPSKGITIKLTSDGTTERWVEIVSFKTIDSIPGGGGGTDPGGGGTDPGGTTPKDLGATVDTGCGCITWPSTPRETKSFKVYKNGVLVDTLSATAWNYKLPAGSEIGNYSIRAYDSSGTVIAKSDVNIPTWNSGGGGTDPGGGTPDPGGGSPDPGGGTPDPGGGTPTDPTDPAECPPGCQAIIDALECPEFDEYLGRWASIIPPPPDWNQVAGIMRDTIVPAMGQEIVNRSPEIARIIADELQSREKAVQPPPSLPAYRTPEPMPTMRDLPSKVPFDVESGTPNFEPDYTQSQPIVIPDPLDVKLDDKDSGYDYPTKTDDSSPPYQAVTRIDQDKGYQGKPSQDTSSPGYQIKNDTVNDPAPEYYYINGGKTQVPIYKPRDTAPTPAPDYIGTGGGGTVPDYKP